MKLLLLLLLLCHSFGLSLPARGRSIVAAEKGEGKATDTPYRDSLMTRIYEYGSVSVDCYLAYPIGDSVVYPHFADNAAKLATLRRFLDYALNDTLLCVQQISIIGYSSLDGKLDVNEQLAHRRTHRFAHYLEADYQLSTQYPLNVHSVGADWGTFRRLIAQSTYHWKHQALAIVDGNDSHERKKQRLTALGDGNACLQIYENIYPRMRRVEVHIDYDLRRMPVPSSSTPLFDVSYLPQQGVLTPLPPPRRPARYPLIALKTNLLFDLAMMPTVEMELSLGQRWSVGAEYIFPWWLIDNNKYCLQLLYGGVEGRYWLGKRTVAPLLTGHYLGLYAGGGKYDLQWKEDGYQGEFFIAAGLSYGYALRLSPHWAMEFGVGFGLLRTDYRRYSARNNYQTLVWVNNGRYSYLGPTKARIALVWLLGGKRKGGGR